MEVPRPPEALARSNADTTSEHLWDELEGDADSWRSFVSVCASAAFTKDSASSCALASVSLKSFSKRQHHKAPAPKPRMECSDEPQGVLKNSGLLLEVDRHEEGDLGDDDNLAMGTESVLDQATESLGRKLVACLFPFCC